MTGYLFHQFFYLPMGDPADDDRDMWAGKGILGWARVAKKVGRKIVLVSPVLVKDVPSVSRLLVEHIPSDGAVGDNGAELLPKVRETSERYPGEALLFLFEAGTPAKLVISEMARTTYKDIYIDMGTVLDGYAGLRSRDYNDPQMYCRKTRARNESVDDWFRPNVCG